MLRYSAPGLSGPDPPRLLWGALAALVVLGVLAMHSLTGGQHAVHLTPAAASAGETSGHGGHEPESVEVVVAGAVMAAGPSSAQAAACGPSGCGQSAGVVCLALALSLMLATVARRVGTWPACPPRTNTVANAAAYGPLDIRAALSPSQLGISRT